MKNLIPLGLLLVTAVAANGNGGGFHYGVKFSGSVAPFEPSGTERVQIMEEHLEINLDAEGADVEVRYVMKNVTRRRATVTFGFPIEATNQWMTIPKKPGEQKRAPTRKEVLAAKEATKKYCQDYFIYADGEDVKFDHIIEPFALGAVKKFRGSERLEGIAGWMRSTLTFKGGQERKVTIRYRTAYEEFGTAMTSGSYTAPTTFKYRLSTAGVWAGPIAKGSIKIKVTGADKDFVEIKKPSNRFKRDGMNKYLWKWSFENLEPTMADDIEIITAPARGRIPHYGEDGERTDARFVRTGENWQFNHRQYTAKASSTLPSEGVFSYGAENLLSGKNASWSEGVDGHGIGETIELAVKKPLPLDELIIFPGYARSQELFEANSRPARVTITLNGEHEFKSMLADRRERQRIAVRDYDKPVKSVKLKIENVYRGDRFADTCISDISLLSRLPGKPKLRPSR